MALFERRTALGVLTEAVGINPEASRLAGVRSRGIIWTAYAVSGLLAGLAGILYSSNIMAADANAAGLYIELDAILAVVLGGTSLMGGKFTLAGTVVGVFTIQTLKSTITFLGVPPAVSPLFLAIVVVIVVLVQSPRLRGYMQPRAGARSRTTPHQRRIGGRVMTTTQSVTSTERPLPTVVQRFLSRRGSWVPVFAALLILIVMFVVAQAYFGNFLTPRVISSLLLDNAYLLILAVGMTFVILTGGIDLSVGAVMAFTGMAGASMLRDGVPAIVVVPAMLLSARRWASGSACSCSTSTCSPSSHRSRRCSPRAGSRSW